MTPRENFKVAFLARCIRDGLSVEEMTERAKEAADKLAGLSDLLAPLAGGVGGSMLGNQVKAPGLGAGLGAALSTEGGRSLLGSLTGPAAALAMVAPVIVGGLGAYGLSRATDVNDEDIQSVKDRELLNTYQTATNKLKRQRAVRDFVRRRDAGSRFRQP